MGRSYARNPGASSNGHPRKGFGTGLSGSEFAFLALGLLLGAASGAAVVFTFRSRPPSREVRLTVTRDVVPRRSSTLSSGSLLTRPGDPAPGGPADRRQTDRGPLGEEPDRRAAVAVGPGTKTPLHDRGVGESRTPVRVGPGVAVAIEPEVDPAFERLRGPRVGGPLVSRILEGDHRAMLTALDSIAGPDGPTRREWEGLLAGLVEAIRERAIDLGILDFPMGAPFWDSFTIEQCRRIAATLALMGYRFDGRKGWTDGKAPSYHDLAAAVNEVGIDPRRVRAWPNALEMGDLYRDVRPATVDALAAYAPTLDPRPLRDLLADRGEGLDDLWLAWEPVRRILLDAEPASVV